MNHENDISSLWDLHALHHGNETSQFPILGTSNLEKLIQFRNLYAAQVTASKLAYPLPGYSSEALLTNLQNIVQPEINTDSKLKIYSEHQVLNLLKSSQQAPNFQTNLINMYNSCSSKIDNPTGLEVSKQSVSPSSMYQTDFSLDSLEAVDSTKIEEIQVKMLEEEKFNHQESTTVKKEDGNSERKTAGIRFLPDPNEEEGEEGSHKKKSNKKSIKEHLYEEDLDYEEKKGKRALERELKDEVFKPTKHVYYLTKNSIIKKRVLPKRGPSNLDVPDKIVAQDNPMELLYKLVSLLEPILGYKDIDQTKAYSILKKSDMNVEVSINKVKFNLCYYRRVLKMK